MSRLRGAGVSGFRGSGFLGFGLKLSGFGLKDEP